MPILALVIVGLAAGFVATRLMRLNTDLVTTMAIGVAGALIGGMVLRAGLMLMGWAAGFVGEVIGAVVLIWAWKKLFR